MGGNHQLFGSLAKKYLSDNKWAGEDMYPAWGKFADELESLLGMLEVEGQIDRYLPKLKAKQQKRDEALAELRVAYFFKRSGYRVVEWEPIGNANRLGEFNIARKGGPKIFVEVKSPGWESELTPRQIDAGRAKQPKYVPEHVEAGAVSLNKPIHRSIDKAYGKFMDNCPNLLVLADDLHLSLRYRNSGNWASNVALYDTSTADGVKGYFTSTTYEKLGGIALFNFGDLPTYYFRIYENPYALEACKLPQTVIDLKEGE